MKIKKFYIWKLLFVGIDFLVMTVILGFSIAIKIDFNIYDLALLPNPKINIFIHIILNIKNLILKIIKKLN